GVVQHLGEHRRTPVALPQPGAAQDHISGRKQRGRHTAVVDRMGHDFGPPRQQRGHVQRAGGDVDQPGAAPQRRLGRQRDRAAVTAVAADAEHAAVVALVAVARARPQPAREVVFAQDFQLVRGASHGRDSILAPAVTIPLPTLPDNSTGADPAQLAQRIRDLAREAGFQRCGISDIVLDEDEGHLRDWLAQGLYGSMDWMARHGDKRSRPAELIPGTLRVISVGLDYGRRDDQEAWETLADGERAYVARYALGR